MTMAAVLLFLGFIIGVSLAGLEAGFFGLLIAGAIWLMLTLVSFTGGDQILLASSSAVPITHDIHPQLFNIIEEMKIAAGLPAMPKIYIINDPAPNAFATGRNPQNASIAVTAGLLGKLNRDELQGVIAHEISHIVHRDILFVTLAGIMLGSIVLLSRVFLRSTYYGAGSRRRYSSGGKGGGQGAAVILIIALVAAILAPIMAQLLYFALSRKREYLADAGAARLTRYPEGLASALEKIAYDNSPQLASANKVTAPMYIANPLKKDGLALSNLTSTHPPIEERIKILRTIAHNPSFREYAQAYSQVTGTKSIIPPSALKTDEQISFRPPSPESVAKQKIEKQTHQVADIIRRVNGFLFLPCACGLTLKIPPNFSRPDVNCPRCNRNLTIPQK